MGQELVDGKVVLPDGRCKADFAVRRRQLGRSKTRFFFASSDPGLEFSGPTGVLRGTSYCVGTWTGTVSPVT